MTERIIRRSIKDEIYKALRDRIQYCELKPGAAINEAALIAEFGVSKTPIREALNTLAQEHLIDIYPQSGTFVSRIDVVRLKDLSFMRDVLDNAVNLELARRKDPLNTTVDKYLALSEFAIQEGDWRECVRLDYAFHKELYRLSGHPDAWDVIEHNVLPYFTRLRFFDEGVHQEYKERPSTHDEHCHLVDCIRHGDTEAILDNDAFRRHKYWFRKVYERVSNTQKSDFFLNLDLLK